MSAGQSVSAYSSRVLDFGRHRLLTPTLFASYRLGDCPEAGLKRLPWAVTETEAVLINAYDFHRPRFRRRLENGWHPETDLDLGGRPLLIDSGAY